MVSNKIKKTVTKLHLFYCLIFSELGRNLSVTFLIKVAKVTKVTERLHAKKLCLSRFEGDL